MLTKDDFIIIRERPHTHQGSIVWGYIRISLKKTNEILYRYKTWYRTEALSDEEFKKYPFPPSRNVVEWDPTLETQQTEFIEKYNKTLSGYQKN